MRILLRYSAYLSFTRKIFQYLPTLIDRSAVAKAVVKRPQAGQQSQAKRQDHQSKQSASGNAADTKLG
jgi:hypothetical protein